MSRIVQGFDSTAGDPHQRLVNAVHEGGPQALAATLGDQAYLLMNLALQPQALFTPSDRGTIGFKEVVGRIHELRSAMDALEARAVVALADSLTLEKQAELRARAAQEADQVPPTKKLLREASRSAARDVSMIIGRSPASAAHSLASQRRLVADMPEMLTALATAQVTSDVAHGASRSFSVLSPTQRAEADRLLGERLPALDAAGSEEWDGVTAAVISRTDPYGHKRRHLRAKQERHVTVRRAEHGMATVSARVSGLDAARIRKRLSLEAERLRAAGDRRGHQAIQADAFVDTLLGQEQGMEPVALDIGVMITERALIHPGTGELAHIEGYGTAPVEVLREELRGALGVALTAEAEEAMGPDGPALRAVMRRLYTHPRTGELVAVESRARAFPPALARFIRWRDQTCRGPFCDAAIRQSDHVHPHAAGGATCLDNGQGLCAFCNDKEQQARSVKTVGDPAADGHAVEWISHTGTRRTTRPPALTDPKPPRRIAAPKSSGHSATPFAPAHGTAPPDHGAEDHHSRPQDRPASDPASSRSTARRRAPRGAGSSGAGAPRRPPSSPDPETPS